MTGAKNHLRNEQQREKRTRAEGRGKREESKDEREEITRDRKDVREIDRSTQMKREAQTNERVDERNCSVLNGRDGREKGQPLGEKREDRRE